MNVVQLTRPLQLLSLVRRAFRAQTACYSNAPSVGPDSLIFSLGRTGKRVDLTWPDDLVAPSVQPPAENSIMKVLLTRGEYVDGLNLPPHRRAQIEQVCLKEGVLVEQALSLRKQLLVEKIMKSGFRMRKEEANIRSAYANGDSIAQISKRTDLPAVALLRAVLVKRVRKYFDQLTEKEIKTVVKWALRWGSPEAMEVYDSEAREKEKEREKDKDADTGGVQAQGLGQTQTEPGGLGGRAPTTRSLEDAARSNMINGPAGGVRQALEDELFWTKVLGLRDRVQLQIAKSLDQASFQEDFVQERDVSSAWEEALYAHLDASNVSYYNELELVEMGSKITPDAVFADDVYINNVPVRWIDCKCYYGSTQSGPFQEKLLKQVGRYNEQLGGSGAILYKLGFSQDLRRYYRGQALVLGQGPLASYNLGMDLDL